MKGPTMFRAATSFRTFFIILLNAFFLMLPFCESNAGYRHSRTSRVGQRASLRSAAPPNVRIVCDIPKTIDPILKKRINLKVGKVLAGLGGNLVSREACVTLRGHSFNENENHSKPLEKKSYIVEVVVPLKGQGHQSTLVAKDHASSFFNGIDKCSHKLAHQLTTIHSKSIARIKRRKLKESLASTIREEIEEEGEEEEEE